MAQRVTANSRVGRPASKPKAPKTPNVIGVAGKGPIISPPVPVYKPPRPPKAPVPKVKQAKPVYKPLGVQTRVPVPGVPDLETRTKVDKQGNVHGGVYVTGTNLKQTPAQIKLATQAQQSRNKAQQNLNSVNYNPKTGKPYQPSSDRLSLGFCSFPKRPYGSSRWQNSSPCRCGYTGDCRQST